MRPSSLPQTVSRIVYTSRVYYMCLNVCTTQLHSPCLRFDANVQIHPLSISGGAYLGDSFPLHMPPPICVCTSTRTLFRSTQQRTTITTIIPPTLPSAPYNAYHTDPQRQHDSVATVRIVFGVESAEILISEAFFGSADAASISLRITFHNYRKDSISFRLIILSYRKKQ